MYYKENKLIIENFLLLCVHYFIESEQNILLCYEMCLRSIMNANFVISPTRPFFSKTLFIDGENPRDQIIDILSKNENLRVVTRLQHQRHLHIMKQAYLRDVNFDKRFTSEEIRYFKYIIYE